MYIKPNRHSFEVKQHGQNATLMLKYCSDRPKSCFWKQVYSVWMFHGEKNNNDCEKNDNESFWINCSFNSG